MFGGKLAAALLRKNLFDFIVAGRSIEKAEVFCRIHGGRPVHLDSSAGDFQNSLAKLSPFVIVDAAGPFQSYQGGDYRVAEAALKAGSHYLDLSDDAEFTRGIDCLDESAKKRDLVLLSGVSSVPALSSTAVEALRPAFSRIDLIETTLLPGNKAPRGLSVIQAILAQAGHPLTVTRSGQIETFPVGQVSHAEKSVQPVKTVFRRAGPRLLVRPTLHSFQSILEPGLCCFGPDWSFPSCTLGFGFCPGEFA